MYNRYACHRGEFRRTEPKHDPCVAKHGSDPPPPPPPQSRGKEAWNPLSFLNLKSLNLNSLNFLNILPKDLDLGDIILYLVLFLLYLENKDEEYLIILLVLLFMK